MNKFKINKRAWYLFTKRDLIITIILLLVGYFIGRWDGVVFVLILNLCLLAFLGYVRSGENARKIDIILKALIKKKIITNEDAILISATKKPFTWSKN